MAINKKIIEKYNMFTNVDNVLTDNLIIITMVPAILALRNVFRTSYLLVHDLYQVLVLKKTGNALAKQATEVALGKRAAAVCGSMKFYAQNENDLVLFEQVNYSPSALIKLRDLELQETSEALYNLANGLATELVPYGVKASDLTEFNNLVELYKVLNPKVRAVRVQGKTDLGLLWKRIEDLNNLLRVKMDNGMQVFQFSEPEFYDLYKNARRNYHLPTQPEADPEMAAAKKQLNIIKKEVAAEKKQAAALKAKAAKKEEENAKINAETDALTNMLADLKLNNELNSNIEPVEKNGESNGVSNGALENGHAV